MGASALSKYNEIIRGDNKKYGIRHSKHVNKSGEERGVVFRHTIVFQRTHLMKY